MRARGLSPGAVVSAMGMCRAGKWPSVGPADQVGISIRNGLPSGHPLGDPAGLASGGADPWRWRWRPDSHHGFANAKPSRNRHIYLFTKSLYTWLPRFRFRFGFGFRFGENSDRYHPFSVPGPQSGCPPGQVALAGRVLDLGWRGWPSPGRWLRLGASAHDPPRFFC